MKGNRTALLLVLLAVTGVTIAAAPAAGQSDSDGLFSPMDDIEDREGDGFILDDGLSTAKSGVEGWFQRQQYNIARSSINPFSSEPETTAQEEADAVRTYFNNNTAAYEDASWLQGKIDATSEIETVKVTLHVNGDAATFYTTGNATSGGNYTDLQAVEEISGEPDAELHLCGAAAENAEEELRTFTEEYAAPDTAPSQQYYAEKWGRYKNDVEDRYGNLFSSEGECL